MVVFKLDEKGNVVYTRDIGEIAAFPSQNLNLLMTLLVLVLACGLTTS